MNLPTIIQGGMGAAVSSWKLARAVALAGQMGVVSGTALDVVLARRLQDGDPGGEIRSACEEFPMPGVVERVLARHYVAVGRPAHQPYRTVAMPSAQPGRSSLELTVLANFVEVRLAKRGHDGLVGINLLEKIQVPTLPSLFGAMLAGVDAVLMGAGIPMAIPGILDRLAARESVRLKLDVEDVGPGEEFHCTFSPEDFLGGLTPVLKRPLFIAVVSSHILAQALARRASGRVDGFVVEGATAGGHNAPPRGSSGLNARGEPVYGPRDLPDLAKFRALGLPFWLAGSYGTRERIAEAHLAGATGIQVGTAFAFCDESGIAPDLKRRVLAASIAGTLDVLTDPVASPTGFPFKIVQLAGSLSDPSVLAGRSRRCDLGYLRTAYRKPDGTLGFRCSGEPEDQFVAKGGRIEETKGRMCVCNGLVSTIGLGQVLEQGFEEAPLVTAGDDVRHLARVVASGRESYSAADVLRHLLGQTETPTSVGT
jgi:nitronate monooxygenase